MSKKKTAVEVYLSTVFKWGLIILVSACMCATVTFNTEKLFGLYPNVPWLATIGLGIMDLIFFAIAILIVRTSFDKDGYLKDGRLKLGKIFSVVVLVIQWNYLLYMLPTRTFWGFLFFFLILMAFFLDIKMLLGSGIACMISLFIGWVVKGTELLPVKDELFLTDVIICLIALVLSLAGLIIFVFFVAHFLVNAKKDELEKITNILLTFLRLFLSYLKNYMLPELRFHRSQEMKVLLHRNLRQQVNSYLQEVICLVQERMKVWTI